MIKTISIQNYQSHKDTQLELSPGVNVIVGPTDAGKSAILRAILWNLYNRPLGDGFQSHWDGETAVRIHFDDCLITRTKGKAKNEYFLGMTDDETVFKAFGQEVPAEILAAHNLDRVLNTQAQIDPFFLLQSSPGEVAKYFNQIAGLESIDHLTKALAQHVRKVKQEITSGQLHLSTLKDDLKEYEHLNAVDVILKQAEQTKLDLDQAVNYRNYLSGQITRIKTAKIRLEQAKEKLRVKEPVKAALALYDELGRLNGLINTWTKMKDRMVDKIKSVTDQKVRLTEMKAKFKKLMPKVCPLCEQEVKQQ